MLPQLLPERICFLRRRALRSRAPMPTLAEICRERRSVILQIEHKPLAVDDLAVLSDHDVDARAALGVDQFDSLRHCVGMLTPCPASRTGCPSRLDAGPVDVFRQPVLEIYE
jgi:hypothetical protein